jgi:hypothetical protein
VLPKVFLTAADAFDGKATEFGKDILICDDYIWLNLGFSMSS